MYAKFISSVVLLLAVINGALALIACGDPPASIQRFRPTNQSLKFPLQLPACPSFAPCPPCASDEFCCQTLGSTCVVNGGFCPVIG
ncbi:hypothetical protein FB45DRAFT_1061695 [Roridomyces roridus]|uniref:Uncharacterized protein n=1 Tax=Roridomyces roridus TaxID=1738132 RepID=A0AAD7BIA5_9AGAR|nr:hypothetical protein FB45DRAFT_1061695 [Roridomyces roridus]